MERPVILWKIMEVNCINQTATFHSLYHQIWMHIIYLSGRSQTYSAQKQL